jgi:hypothetical protein
MRWDAARAFRVQTAPSSSTVLAGQAQRVAKLSISATPAPSMAHQLYPGGTGDVALTIRNPIPYPRPGATPVVVGLDGVVFRPRTGPGSVIPL